MNKNWFIDIETTGLKPEECRITCISNCDEKEKMTTFSQENEELMLIEFNEWCATLHEDTIFWAKNGKQFDYPFIEKRMKKYGITWFIQKKQQKEIDKYLPKNKKNGRCISLSKACELYGLEDKTASGIEAIFMWKYKNWILEIDEFTRDLLMWDELITYCEQDARLVKKIWEIKVKGNV